MNGKSWSVNGVAVMVLVMTLLVFGTFANAAPQVVDIEGAGYNVTHSMVDNLKAYKGKKVYVTLDSGKTMTGSVKEVGEHLLHLEKLEGKEYFDALIRIEEIGAIDARFREQKR